MGWQKFFATKVFGKYLLVTNLLTCGTLMGCADVIEQKFEKYRDIEKDGKKHDKHDWPRTGRMVAVGICQGGPQHFFYKILDRALPLRNFATVAKKIILDQIIQSPMCITLFFVGLGLLEGKRFADIKEEMRKKFLFVYAIDWTIWPPCNVINFYYVQPRFRVVYISFVTMFFDLFLAYIKFGTRD